MFGIGAGEFVVILIVGLIVFGPSKLPELGRAIGKTLREFRKAQAALSATLNESLDSEKKSAPAENSAPVERPVSAETVSIKPVPVEKPSPVEKSASVEKLPSAEKTSAPTADDIINAAKKNPFAATEKPATVNATAEDVINLARENPIVKENHDEKIFNGNAGGVPANDGGARPAGAGRGANGAGE